MDSTLCPLCVRVVPLPELPSHLTANHSVMPQSSINSLLLWVLTINNNLTNISNKNNENIGLNKANKDGDKLNKLPTNGGGLINENSPKPPPMTSLAPSLMPPVVNFPMMLQNVFPTLGGKLNLPVGKLFPPPLSGSTAATLPTLPLPSVGGTSAPIPSFLQALLNGDAANASAALPSTDERRSFVTPTSPMPTKATVEGVVGKLTRKHVGPNDKVTIFGLYYIHGS